MTKVFGIGFHKTGTTSLNDILTILGYQVLGISLEARDAWVKEDWEALFKIVDQYDAFQDNPWPMLYQKLDRQYPNSKFILTYRPVEDWINSVINHFGGKQTKMRELIYGIADPLGSEDEYKERYEKHNQEVQTYFADRPNDFLLLDWRDNKDWEQICSFLNKTNPQVEFPKSNTKTQRLTSKKSGSLLKRMIYKWRK